MNRSRQVRMTHLLYTFFRLIPNQQSPPHHSPVVRQVKMQLMASLYRALSELMELKLWIPARIS